VIRHRGGTCGGRSVNVPRDRSSFPLPAGVLQEEIDFPAAVPDVPWPGYHPLVHRFGNRPAPRHAAGREILAQTVSRPQALSSASVSVTPSIPSSTDAVSWAGASSPLFLIVTNRDHRVRASLIPVTPVIT
jgi:hypothetical protein